MLYAESYVLWNWEFIIFSPGTTSHDTYLLFERKYTQTIGRRYEYKIKPHMVSKLKIEFITDMYSIIGETARFHF